MLGPENTLIVVSTINEGVGGVLCLLELKPSRKYCKTRAALGERPKATADQGHRPIG